MVRGPRPRPRPAVKRQSARPRAISGNGLDHGLLALVARDGRVCTVGAGLRCTIVRTCVRACVGERVQRADQRASRRPPHICARVYSTYFLAQRRALCPATNIARHTARNYAQKRALPIHWVATDL